MIRLVRCMHCYEKRAVGAVVYKDEKGKELARIHYCEDHKWQAERKAQQYANYKGEVSYDEY